MNKLRESLTGPGFCLPHSIAQDAIEWGTQHCVGHPPLRTNQSPGKAHFHVEITTSIHRSGVPETGFAIGWAIGELGAFDFIPTRVQTPSDEITSFSMAETFLAAQGALMRSTASMTYIAS